MLKDYDDQKVAGLLLDYLELLVLADLRPSTFHFEFFIQLRKEGLV